MEPPLPYPANEPDLGNPQLAPVSYTHLLCNFFLVHQLEQVGFIHLIQKMHGFLALIITVSYTHLDVYKRQVSAFASQTHTLKI